MRDLAVLTFMTLDGVMQAPSDPEEDTEGGFSRGGWARPWWDETMEMVGEHAMATPYDLLLGRKTYESFAAHWSAIPDKEGPAAFLNGTTKYVATNSLSDLSWQNSFKIDGDIASGIRELKSGDGKLLQVHGSAQLIQLLTQHDLIDEYRLWTFPVIAGSGKRLFETAPPMDGFSLEKTDRTKGGVVMTIYRCSR